MNPVFSIYTKYFIVPFFPITKKQTRCFDILLHRLTHTSLIEVVQKYGNTLECFLGLILNFNSKFNLGFSHTTEISQ